MSARWWATAIVLAALAVVMTLTGGFSTPGDWPVPAYAVFVGVSALIWVWFLEAIVSGVRRAAQRGRH